MGELVMELITAGHEVQWFVAPIDGGHPSVLKARELGVKVYKLPAAPKNYVRLKGIRRSLDRILNGESLLYAQMNRFSPDFLFINQGGTWCGTDEQYAKSLALMRNRYAIIVHLNSHYDSATTEKAIRERRALFANAKTVYFPSKWCQQIAEMQIASPVNNACMFRYPHRFSFEPLPWPENSRVAKIAFVGRLDTFHKGIDLCLESLKIARLGGYCFSCTIYGDGSDLFYLKSLVRYFGLEDMVFFAGHTSDIKNIWLKNEILFLPSRMEGCSVALTEAMGFGRPVITTAVGGAPELIEDGRNGYLALAPEVTLISRKLIEALDNRTLWPQVGYLAYKKIANLFPPKPASIFLRSLN